MQNGRFWARLWRACLHCAALPCASTARHRLFYALPAVTLLLARWTCAAPATIFATLLRTYAAPAPAIPSHAPAPPPLLPQRSPASPAYGVMVFSTSWFVCRLGTALRLYLHC